MAKMVEDDFEESTLFSAPITKKLELPAMDGNPLSQYFRLPGISVGLPTGGVFMPPGTIELNDEGQVEVLPMRGADEILLSSPDALMNNSAIYNLIKSCVPRIKAPEYVSVPDLDVLLLAIRVASTGENMEVELSCEKCREMTKFELNVPSMIGTAKTIDPVNNIRISDDLLIKVAPHNLASQTRILMRIFKQTREAQALDLNEDLTDEERATGMGNIMREMADINTFSLQEAITSIRVPLAEVTNRKHIEEFIANTDSGTLNKIKDKLDEINERSVDKTFPAQCSHCDHEWTGVVEFDPASFFGTRSSD